jgi:hypothetical protein
VLSDEKSAQFVSGPFLIQPITLLLFVLIFLLIEQLWLENSVGGSWAGQICPFLAKNLHVRYYNTLTKPAVHVNRDKKSQKNNQIIMRSTRSSDYVAISGGTMALVAGANCSDDWPEGRCLEARRRRIMTAPQLQLMLMTATVAKLKSRVSARAKATVMAP